MKKINQLHYLLYIMTILWSWYSEKYFCDVL